MHTHTSYLFVYGSLLDNDNEFGAYLKTHSKYITKGTFRGWLYDMGEYPGAVAHPNAEGEVHGSVLLLNNASSVMKKLDAYEGYGDNEEQPNLFIRQLISIATPSGTMHCWVYLYNLPVQGLPQIKSGRYRA